MVLKKTLCIILSVLLLATLVCSCYLFTQQKFHGTYGPVSTVTERSRQWLLDRFGDCQTVPQLLTAIDKFGCKHFIYDLYPMPLIQTFDLDQFIFEDDLHGVCFEFSCFVKCAVLVWSEHHGRGDVQAFVYDVRLPKGGGHSYNFIVEEDHTWYLCLTTNNTRAKKGLDSLGFEELVDISIKDYISQYGERIQNIN